MDKEILGVDSKKLPGGSKTPAWEHVYIYSKIKEKAKISPYVRPKMILEELKRICRVPKTLHYPILKQMEEEGLIKRVNHQKYEFTTDDKDERIKELNKLIEELKKVGKRNRMLKSMEECGFIRKVEGTKYLVMQNDCDDKLKYMGNYTFW